MVGDDVMLQVLEFGNLEMLAGLDLRSWKRRRWPLVFREMIVKMEGVIRELKETHRICNQQSDWETLSPSQTAKIQDNSQADDGIKAPGSYLHVSPTVVLCVSVPVSLMSSIPVR